MVTYEELVPVPHHRIMLIKVGKVKRENLYEMTRKYWKVSLERAKTSTHVLAVINGIVVAEFIPQKWFITENRELNVDLNELVRFEHKPQTSNSYTK